MRLRSLVADIRRTADGARALVRSLTTRDEVDIGIGELIADAPVAHRGRPNRYRLTIASARSAGRTVTVAIDIYALDTPAHPEGHYANFFTRVHLRPRASTRIDIEYDWAGAASFRVGPAELAVDHLWRGTLDRATRYSVTGVLLDADGRQLESLTVYQELRA